MTHPIVNETILRAHGREQVQTCDRKAEARAWRARRFSGFWECTCPWISGIRPDGCTLDRGLKGCLHEDQCQGQPPKLMHSQCCLPERFAAK